MDELIKLRKKIDKIDRKLAELLRKRAIEVIKIRELKKLQQLSVIDLDREQEILKNLESDYEKNIFRQILTESRKLQKKPDRASTSHRQGLKTNNHSDIM